MFREGHQSVFYPPSTIQMAQMGTFGSPVVQVCVRTRVFGFGYAFVCVCVCVVMDLGLGMHQCTLTDLGFPKGGF